MKGLKIECHAMYLAVLLTFTPINYLSTCTFTNYNLGRLLANVESSIRNSYIELLRSIDTSYEKEYLYEVNGEKLISKRPVVHINIPLPCNEILLNLLSEPSTLERYVNNYKNVILAMSV